jgi:hypothetical protein
MDGPATTALGRRRWWPKGLVTAFAPHGQMGARWPVLVGWAVGLWIAFAPTLASGFGRMQSDWGDTRLNNYILEHGYRWLIGDPGHRALWSPPVFFPAPNTGAYSDILLGVAPFYWFWRALGIVPDTAFQLWTMTIASLNYAAAVICCRRLLGVGWTAAAFGGFVFAYGGTRLGQIDHQQLMGQFYALVACYAVARIFEESPDAATAARAEARRPWWIALAGASVAAQLWAAYYMGWFLAFGLAIGLAWGIALPERRRRLAIVVRQSLRPIAWTALGCTLALLPLALPYLRAATDVGMRTYANVTWYLPRVWSWFFLGRESRLYGWMYRLPFIHDTPEGHEHRLGVGLVTTAIAIAGLWGARRRPAIQLLAATAITIVLLATVWPGGSSAWIIVYHLVPGAAAIRGVSRIALLLLIPAGAGVALFIERFRLQPLVLVLAAIVITGEQLRDLKSYIKSDGRRRVAIVAAAVRPDCLAFFYSPTTGREDPWWYQVDGMWASMNTGVPTINGYSGNVPPGWLLYKNQVVTPAHDRELTADLDAWVRRWHLDPARVCRITTPTSD